MYVVLLKFAQNRDEAGRFMEAHNQWLQRGFDDGVFVLAGSLQVGLGGALIACNTTPEELRARVNEDPFVANDVVSVEILEISPSKVDSKLQFLLA
ncbi:MAG: YciI family protein [Gammaproteobacteria bacterium]|nr:YciI family protein [Gammaproteobacteria bacterium]MDH5799787.1 YciI family protein [Gammaproteobacteria bacterium]